MEAERLYGPIAEQARAAEFHLAGGVPDTAEGRFELLALHMTLAISRLKSEEPRPDRLIRRLQEVFFERLDSGLREMGVGDLVVGRKIRALAEAFYGRLLAYERGLAEEGDALEDALARNVLNVTDGARARALAAYARAAHALLASAAAEELAFAFAKMRETSRSHFAGADA